jgi:heavy metal sensor kinase
VILARLTVRARLTLWYAATLGIVLLGYSYGLYLQVRSTLAEGIDHQLREDVEALEEDLPRLRTTEDPPEHRDKDQWLLEILSEAGQVVRSWPSFETSPVGAPQDKCRSRKMEYYSVRLEDGLELRVGCKAARARGEPQILRSARSAAKVSAELARLRAPMILGIPATLLLCALGGYLLAYRALRPLGHMAKDAAQITAEAPGQRLSVGNPHDELGQLASTFNETFARLERSFEQTRRFTSDASHELRTPLSAIRTLGEVALKDHPDDPSALRETLSSVLEEADALLSLVESLLTLSRADAGNLPLSPETIQLSTLVADVVGQLSVLAEEKQQTLLTELDPQTEVLADRMLLRRAIANLVDNAIKYSPPGSSIRVRVLDDSQGPRFEVDDEGPGIELHLQERVFDRFYRVDTSRSRSSGGAGLGLAIARWAAQANGGHISLHSDGRRGSVFRLVLPRAPCPAERGADGTAR